MEIVSFSNVFGYPEIEAGKTYKESLWHVIFMEILLDDHGKYILKWYHTTHDGQPTLESLPFIMKIANRDIPSTTKSLCDNLEEAKAKMFDNANYRSIQKRMGYKVLYFPFDISTTIDKVNKLCNKYGSR